MPLIEGIGDEVTVLASVLIVSMTLLIAWLSTFVSDRPSVRAPSLNSEASALEQEELINNADARIEDVIYDTQWSGGTEHARTEQDSPTNLTGANSNSVQNERDTSENVDSVSGSVPTSRDSTSFTETERTSPESRQESIVQESLSSNVVRNRLTGQVNPVPGHHSNTPSQSIHTSSTSFTTDDQSKDAAQTGGEDTQSYCVCEETPENQGEGDQSEEQTQADGQDQAAEGSICIRIKYLTDRERVVYANPTDSLGEFRRRTFSEEIQSGQTVRLIFHGQLLQDDNSSLSDLNVTQNCVIHCHLSQGGTASASQQDVHEADVDLGRFMIPLFTCILGFVWYLRWQYRYMFNATSTLSLVGVTTLFVLAVLASWRG